MARSPYSTPTLLPGAFREPCVCAYPFDLNGSLAYMRPATGSTLWPYPTIIGFVSGLLPMQNNLISAGMYGASATGPWSDPSQVRDAGAIFEVNYTRAISPEMPKVAG